MRPDQATLAFENQELTVNDHCHRQLAAWLKIGSPYYQRMLKDSPALLAGNVNHWLRHEDNNGKRRMIRELDGTARAFLSDRYLRLDNDITMQTALEALSGANDVQIKSCDVTNNKLYIKAVFSKTEMDVKLNDPVQCGVVITNSEIGNGSFEVKPLVFRLVCHNGLVVPSTEKGLKRVHLGSQITADSIVYSQDTIEQMAKATLSECRDAIKTFASPDYFQSHVQKLSDAANTVKSNNPEKTVEKLAKNFNLGEGERSSILERFIRDQDYSQYGALNAVTNLANDVENYDRASELEHLGGQILELNRSQWEQVAVTV